MSRETMTWGVSLLKEFGLWAGAAISFFLGLLWSIPWLVVAFVGRGHSSDWFESLLVVCALVVVVCLTACVLFVVGGIRNTVGSEQIVVYQDDSGDSEGM